MNDCPQCGETTPTLYEGYCEYCRKQNQIELNEHNRSYDAWQKMSNKQRDYEINKPIGQE